MTVQGWYLHTAEGQQGPYSSSDLATYHKAGQINDDWYVWREGLPAWQRIGDTPELFATAPVQTTACPLCGGASMNSKRCSLCGADIAKILETRAQQQAARESKEVAQRRNALSATKAHQNNSSSSEVNISAGFAMVVVGFGVLLVFPSGMGVDPTADTMMWVGKRVMAIGAFGMALNKFGIRRAFSSRGSFLKYALIGFVVTVLVIAGVLLLSPSSVPFDSQGWKAAPQDSFVRYSMAHDLIGRHILDGKSIKEVHSLLGAPEKGDSSSQDYPVTGGTLRITYDSAGIVIKGEIVK